jgi:hypothetical protein
MGSIDFYARHWRLYTFFCCTPGKKFGAKIHFPEKISKLLPPRIVATRTLRAFKYLISWVLENHLFVVF